MIARKLQDKENLQVKSKKPNDPPNYPAPPRHHPKPSGSSSIPPPPPQASSSNQYLAHSPDQPTLHYACLDLNLNPERKMHAPSKVTDYSPDKKYSKINLQSHTPEKSVISNQTESVIPPPPRPAKNINLLKNESRIKQLKTMDGVDSIRPYPVDPVEDNRDLEYPMQNLNINNLYKPNGQPDNYREHFEANVQKSNFNQHNFEDELRHEKPKPKKAAANKFTDYNSYDDEASGGVASTSNAPINEIGLPMFSRRNDPMPSTSSQFSEKIERLQALKLSGLPAEEIKEIDKRIDQEKRDEVRYFFLR